MSIDHGKLLALADAPPIPAWLIDADQSRVWAAAWETLYRAITLAQPAEAHQLDAAFVAANSPSERVSPERADAMIRRMRERQQPAEAAQSATINSPETFTTSIDAAQGAVAHTMINHERDPHCIGCYVIRWNDGDPVAECNECGHHVALLDQLVTHPQAAPAQGDVAVGYRGALRALLSAMDMQEKRESGEFHLSQPAAKHYWDTAKKRAAELLAASPSLEAGHTRRSASAPAQGVPDDLARDAARYRYLRQPNHCILYARHPNAWGRSASDNTGHVRYDTPEQLDAAIDEALAASPSPEGES